MKSMWHTEALGQFQKDAAMELPRHLFYFRSYASKFEFADNAHKQRLES